MENSKHIADIGVGSIWQHSSRRGGASLATACVRDEECASPPSRIIDCLHRPPVCPPTHSAYQFAGERRRRCALGGGGRAGRARGVTRCYSGYRTVSNGAQGAHGGARQVPVGACSRTGFAGASRLWRCGERRWAGWGARGSSPPSPVALIGSRKWADPADGVGRRARGRS